MKTRHRSLVIFVVASWVGLAQSWGGGRRAEDKAHTLAWEAFSADMASVTLPIGQTVTKDEYRLACENSMGDTTVGETSLHDGKLVSIDRVNFSVEAMVTATATSKTGFQQDVSYPAAFFMTIDLRTNKLAEVRMYAQNIALLAARGYTMLWSGHPPGVMMILCTTVLLIAFFGFFGERKTKDGFYF